MIVNVTDANLDVIVKQTSTLVIDIWADWCSPCKVLGKVIDTIAGKYSDVVFGKLNIDSNPETVNRFNIKSVPTLLVFKDGKHVKTLIGLKSEDDIIKQVRG